MINQPIQPNFDAWRDAARGLLARQVPPAEVIWTDARSGTAALPFASSSEEATPAPVSLSIPRAFIDEARAASYFRDDERWSLLYRVAFRIVVGEPHLMSIAVDDDVVRLREMAKAVRRDEHKMHAFVRFRRVALDEGVEQFVAFHRPDHFIVPLVAPFFIERFRPMHWAILTPDESIAWDTHVLTSGPGVSSRDAPLPDDVESLWLTYYQHVFNPARLKVKHMKQELPTRHWRTLPEAQLIPGMIKSAGKRTREMEKTETAADDAKKVGGGDYGTPPVPDSRSLKVLREANRACLACPWACKSTQPVFGDGPKDAQVVLVGEQPGDQEDLAGKPFVGPAGGLLRSIIEKTGYDADALYFTNAVKHFKFEPRGKRRIHQTPSARDVNVCKPWLESELQAIRPKVLVCLGATAAKSILGHGFRITQQRGEVMASEWCPQTIATFHPSAILRVPDHKAADAMREALFEDLKAAFELVRAA